VTVDLDALTRWLDEQHVGRGPLTDVEALGGGTQNVMLRFRRGDDLQRYVLRHPPPHKRDNSDETMRREARLLAALADTDVPAPRLVASCPSLEVLGSAFYVMVGVDGFAPTLGLPAPYDTDPTWRRDAGLSMADAIAALARVDHVRVGLGDFGKPDNWLERQVQRWRSHLEGYGAVAEYPGHGIEGVDEVGAWLDAHRPTQWRPGLIHGDFHLANVMWRFDRPAVAAMVDWELATIGDPLLDLGHVLATWPQPGATAAVGSMTGLATHAEMVERYAQGSDRDVSHVDWYRVLACYRLGIILEGTNVRAWAGRAPRETGDLLHSHTVALFAQARELIG
jgi:aminoglycoside phosphotransferase (APT) family kinase protein